MRSRRKLVRALAVLVTVIALGALVAVAVTSRADRGAVTGQPRHLAASTHKSVPVEPAFDVPFVSRPAHEYVVPAPVPTTLPPATARLCTAADLSVKANGSGAGSQNVDYYFALINISRTVCQLGGFPTQVVARVSGHAPVDAKHGTYFSDMAVPANIAPGRSGVFDIGTTEYCYDSTPRPAPLVARVVITLPGGGDLSLPGTFNVTCGLGADEMGVRRPETTYPEPWYASITEHATLPASARAGSTLVYVVTLANPTAHDISIDQCPSYVEASQDAADVHGREEFELNCQTVHNIGAHASVRYEMKMHVAANAASGPMKIWWQLTGPVLTQARGTVQVMGNDDPCRGDQLTATAPDRATPFRGAGLYWVKDAGTTLAVTLENTSPATCTLQGSPGVRVLTASGTDLGLTYVTRGFGPPAPAGARVTLAPGQSATTDLAWHTRWCAPDPNPVRVRLTLPLNTSVITVDPAHGWTPPPCTGFDFRHTVSSGAFQ